MNQKVLVSNIQQFCTYDGPGIRTVVFLMGCPMRCKWCQNPENFTGKQMLMFDKAKCTSCGACLAACEYQAVRALAEGGIIFERKNCRACGKCTEVCRMGARELCGKYMTTDEVFKEVMKDEIFFRNTGGGITLSGGECMLYPEFIKELFQAFKQKGIHTAIETSGYCPTSAMQEIEDCVDLFLYDFKLDSNELHKKWTKKSNANIKQNLEYLISRGKNVVVRIPLIEGVNDGSEFNNMMRYLKQYPQIKDIHILPFHQIGSSKYNLSDTGYEMEVWKECSVEKAEECKKAAESMGFSVNIGGWNL